MKLLLVTSSVNLNGGGIASYAIDLLSLMKNDFELYVISRDKINIEYQHFVELDYQLDSNDLSFKNTQLFIDIISDINPDIIINSNFRLMSVVVPYLKSSIIKISISHFVDGQLAIVAGYNNKYYDTIIALSHAGKSFIDKYFDIKDSNCVKVIYNFYNGHNQKTYLINKKLTNSPLIITYPGGANILKNATLVYSLVCELQKSQLPFLFYWLGGTKLPGGKFFKPKHIQDIITKDERVVFTGFISRSEVKKIMDKTNVFLLPSKKEGCPISLLEAISTGVISIVADSKHASSEIITNGETGFILPENLVTPYVSLISDIVNNHSNYFHIYTNSVTLHQLKFSGDIWLDNMKKTFYKNPINNTNKRKFRKSLFLKEIIAFKIVLAKIRLKEINRSFKAFVFFKNKELSSFHNNKRQSS